MLRRGAPITGAVFLLIGLALIVGGVQLVSYGFTWYYLVAGLSLAASGVLFALGRREGFWLYLATFLATFVWAVAEVGFDGWQLIPRVLAPAVLLLWISLPPVSRKLSEGRDVFNWSRALWLGGTISIVAIATIFISGALITRSRHVISGSVSEPAAIAQVGTRVPAGDWKFYGRDQAGTRFSPLGEITPKNVQDLKVAWTYHSGDLPSALELDPSREYTVEATPVKVGNSLYICTPHRLVIAVDATTGAEKWRFDPKGNTGSNTTLACRGVAYNRNSNVSADTPCAERILSTSLDARLFALDARTGKLCSDFGKNGFVNLQTEMPNARPGFHFITSQPMVAKGKIMLSGWVTDNVATDEPSGVIRAFDILTGAPAWAWDMGRTPANKPLAPGEKFTPGTPNGWGTFTADETLGLVYVPLGNATPDYFGGQRRPFDEKYSSSLVALDIATGAERWHYQTVHHDLWDFDVPAGPSLFDMPAPGGHGSVPALVLSTKRGEFFVLDRRTGKPLFPVDERPVPQHGVPGERLSPTQPYPRFASVAPDDLTPKRMWGATPIDQMQCRLEYAKLRYEGQFTPPTTQGSIGYPAYYGAVDWQGVTLDPSRHLMFVNSSYIPFTLKMLARDKAAAGGEAPAWSGWKSGKPMPNTKPWWSAQWGLPYAVRVAPFLNSLRIPCSSPPWGMLTAIDLHTGKKVWSRPVGTTSDMGPLGTKKGPPLEVGMPNVGGSISTASGLVFMGAFADNYIRAFDSRTGDELWKARLPAGGQATPASYTGADGRQYVVITAGGHSALGTKSGDSLVAYALPKSR